MAEKKVYTYRFVGYKPVGSARQKNAAISGIILTCCFFNRERLTTFILTRRSRRYQLSVLEVILKFEDLEVWKRSSRLCADLYKRFQDIMGMLLLTTDT